MPDLAAFVDGSADLTVLLPWAMAAPLLTLASAVELPSFANRGWNLAPPVLLGFLAATQQRGPGLVYAAISVLLSYVLTRTVLRHRITQRQALISGSSSGVLLVGWVVLSYVGEPLVAPGIDVPNVIGLVAMISFWLATDALIRAGGASRFKPRNVSAGLLVTDASVGFIASSSIVASVVLWPHLGFWATGVALLPYLVTHRLLTRLVVAHRIQELAIRAIGRLPEAAGLAESNHSVSVEGLALELGRLAGVRGQSLSDLRSAALLHDVGLVCTGREEIRNWGYSGGDVARWGAEILGSSPPLAEVARLIANQADPFRAPGGSPDPALDIRSQIISLACELDRLRATGIGVEEVLDLVYSESAFRFTPELLRYVVPAVEKADRLAQNYRGGS